MTPKSYEHGVICTDDSELIAQPDMTEADLLTRKPNWLGQREESNMGHSSLCFGPVSIGGVAFKGIMYFSKGKISQMTLSAATHKRPNPTLDFYKEWLEQEVGPLRASKGKSLIIKAKLWLHSKSESPPLLKEYSWGMIGVSEDPWTRDRRVYIRYEK